MLDEVMNLIDQDNSEKNPRCFVIFDYFDCSQEQVAGKRRK